MPTGDDELDAILAMPFAEAEALRKTELAEVTAQLPALRALVDAEQIGTPAWHRTSKTWRNATQRAHSARNRNAWLWGKGHRW
ncbi:MAG: hypothetical protein L0H79_21475 [Intrasporangium sp.]|uniref:hypothetical protein n=1 Tax=Intrasporangium sp. TaxID=1925024 RepID=UPI002648F4EC|nr:hypothetical protein [Intrasporangium sp.]MDN5798299.1 hypothetical protein [Intrasporangium sp.]